MKGEKMKKLLLVLLVIAMASFLLVGCIPVTPGEGEGEGEEEICPTVHITSQAAVGTKTYIKGGKQTITVTFAVPTAPVSVYVGADLRNELHDVEVVMYPNADKTIYTGTFEFGEYSGDCGEAYIYVETCDTCAPCKYPYTVDTVHPYAKIKVTADECVCEGVALTFASTSSTLCDVTDVCCDDECSGLASWAIDIYTKDPFDVCCDTPCASPVASCSGVCPVACTTICLPTEGYTGYVSGGYYVLTTLLDEVGNKARYYVKLEPFTNAFLALVKADTGNDYVVSLTEYAQNKAETVGVTGVCSWFYPVVDYGNDTGEYGFCSDSPDNVVTSIAKPD